MFIRFKLKSYFKSHVYLIASLVSWTVDEGHYQIYLDGALNNEGFNLSRSKPIEGNGIFIIGQEQDSIGGTLTHLFQKHIFIVFQQVDSVNLNHLSAKFLFSIFGIESSTPSRSVNITELVTHIRGTFTRGLI